MSGKRVCAWCKADLGDAPDLPDGEVTHGLCERCKAEQLAKLGIVKPGSEKEPADVKV